MILGWRTVCSPTFTGINVFRSFDWTLPIQDLGLACFRHFDTALENLRADRDSTRIAVEGHMHNDALTRFNTATQAALRAVPEKYRRSVWMWTLAVVGTQKERTLWTQLPSWCKLIVENHHGELTRLESTSQSKQWTSAPLSDSDRKLHLAVFENPKSFSLTRARTEDIQFVKASVLLRNTQRPGPLGTLNLNFEADGQ